MTASVQLFGVEIDPLSFDETVEVVLGWADESGHDCRYLLTPNVNHLVLFQDDHDFQQAYAGASLVVADGRYVILLSRLLGRSLPEPVNGSDLVPAVLNAARDRTNSISLFLLGAMPGVAELAATNIARDYPWIDVVGTYSPPLGFQNDTDEQQKILSLVNSCSPDILVLGISPPKQEIWISRFAAQLNTRVAICAGATIDFLAGEKSRAPMWVQRLGLEWVYRMMTEPKRLIPRYFGDGVAILKLLLAESRSKSS